MTAASSIVSTLLFRMMNSPSTITDSMSDGCPPWTTDATLILPVPGAEHVVDLLQALVAQPGRETRRLAFRQPVGRHRARHVLTVSNRFREHPPEPGLRQRAGIPSNSSRVLNEGRRAGSNRFEGTHDDHQRGLFALQQTARLNGELRRVGEAEVLVEPALQRRGQMGVTVNQSRKQRLAASVVNVRIRVGPEDLIRRPDGGDGIADHGQRHVIPDRVGVDDRGVAENNRPARGGLLSLEIRRLEQKRRSARARPGQQLASGDLR